MKHDESYLRIAEEVASRSYCKRNKVGAVLVKDKSIISEGYNGTPYGRPNVCECENGQTHDEVVHAEENAILKVARSSQSCKGATLYLTLSPCVRCSRLIVQAGITRVVYRNKYRCTKGLDLLWSCGIQHEQLPRPL
jgi:dCMP deaminase